MTNPPRQKTGETYTEYQKRVLCQNSSKLGSTNAVVTPQCLNGSKEYRVTVKYSEHDNPSDTSILCNSCKNKVKREAESHGYKVEIEPCE